MPLTPDEAAARARDEAFGFTTDQAPTTFDQFASNYHIVYQHHLIDVRRFVSLADPQPGEKILDLGCGLAWVGIKARKYNKEGRIVGIDCSLKMLDMAAKVIIESGMTGIELVQGDITNLSQLPSIQLSDTFSGFDVITALWTFGGILKSQKQAVLAHWSAFLALGGRIVVDHEHYYRDVATLERRHILGGDEQREGLADAKSWKEYRQQLQKLAKSAGLATKTVERLILPADYPDNTQWSKQAREVWKKEGGKDI